MSHNLRELLPDAEGSSVWVIAVIIDIRDFTRSNLAADALQTGEYIKTVYEKWLTDHFQDATYVKPTGDGLFLIYELGKRAQAQVRELGPKLAEQCYNAVIEFPTLFKSNALFKSPIPNRSGVGIAVGPASRIHSGDVTLDYSGRTLNLCSRLADVARPSGIVISSAIGEEIVPEQLRKEFEEATIFPKSFGAEPVKVVYTKGLTVIPDALKRPSREEHWISERETLPVADIKAHVGYYHPCPSIKGELKKFQVLVEWTVPGETRETAIDITSDCERVFRRGEYEINVPSESVLNAVAQRNFVGQKLDIEFWLCD